VVAPVADFGCAGVCAAWARASLHGTDAKNNIAAVIIHPNLCIALPSPS
jgi:hypothetical protein